MLQGGSCPPEYVEVVLMRELHLTPEAIGCEPITIGDILGWMAALNGEASGKAELRQRAQPLGGFSHAR